MSVAFDGIGRLVVTFEAGTATAGSFVTMEDNGKVRKALSGQLPVGLALHVQDGHAAVQLRGYVKTKYSGSSAPALGWASVSSDTLSKTVVRVPPLPSSSFKVNCLPSEENS